MFCSTPLWHGYDLFIFSIRFMLSYYSGKINSPPLNLYTIDIYSASELFDMFILLSSQINSKRLIPTMFSFKHFIIFF